MLNRVYLHVAFAQQETTDEEMEGRRLLCVGVVVVVTLLSVAASQDDVYGDYDESAYDGYDGDEYGDEYGGYDDPYGEYNDDMYGDYDAPPPTEKVRSMDILEGMREEKKEESPLMWSIAPRAVGIG